MHVIAAINRSSVQSVSNNNILFSVLASPQSSPHCCSRPTVVIGSVHRSYIAGQQQKPLMFSTSIRTYCTTLYPLFYSLSESSQAVESLLMNGIPHWPDPLCMN